MNGPWPGSGGPTSNFAAAGAVVGVQATEVHDVTVYQLTPESNPQQRYQVGARYLDDGLPGKAEDLISQAISLEFDSAEVRFHWILAMFSKRSFRDLTRDERKRLEEAVKRFELYPPKDRYTAALQAVGGLVSGLLSDSRDVEAAETKILDLPPDLAAKVNRHLDQVLSGVTKSTLWRTARMRADKERFDNDRVNRAWTYFEPEPQPPRMPSPRDGGVGPEAHPAEVAGVGAFLIAGAVLGWLSLTSGNLAAIFAFLVAAAAGAAAMWGAYGWRYRFDRIALLARRQFGNGLPDPPMEGNEFAPKLRRKIRYYFAKYRPDGKDAEAWLRETAGARARLGSELTETFRDQRTSVDELRWLIRYHAIETMKRHRSGTLYDFGAGVGVSGRRIARCLVFSGMALVAAVVLFRVSDLGAQVAMVLAGLSGALATGICYRAYVALRGEIDDEKEAEAVYEQREQEFARWQRKLEERFPSEHEMETWLLSDITVLIDKVLHEGKWAWSDVISHAVIRQPGPGRIRRRVRGGPWRYSKYRLHIYLVTVDGVREVVADLDFKSGTFGTETRENFQLDNITSVKVTTEVGGGRVLAMMLNNGNPREIRVAEGAAPPPSSVEMDPSDDPIEDNATAEAEEPDPELLELVRLNLDATGFDHALRMLEGIGADGKGWIERHARA